MSDDANVDLAYLARQQRTILVELASVKDDMAVMMAILQRLDGTVAGLVNEVRATHSRHSRLDRRVRELEAKEER